MSEGRTRESDTHRRDTNKSNLELGDTQGNKRALTVALSVIHLFSFVGIITLLAASTQFSWTRGLVAVLAVVIWLFSFILLFVNAMSYFFAREKRQQARAPETPEQQAEANPEESAEAPSDVSRPSERTP